VKLFAFPLGAFFAKGGNNELLCYCLAGPLPSSQAPINNELKSDIIRVDLGGSSSQAKQKGRSNRNGKICISSKK
jgi:hypothetical protein